MVVVSVIGVVEIFEGLFDVDLVGCVDFDGECGVFVQCFFEIERDEEVRVMRVLELFDEEVVEVNRYYFDVCVGYRGCVYVTNFGFGCHW